MKNLETRERCQVVYDYIIAHPEQHSQRLWIRDAKTDTLVPNAEAINVCDTTMCVAGTATYLYETPHKIQELLGFGYRHAGEPGSWEETGAKILGLTMNEAARLFYMMEEEVALDMLLAAANGDRDKFNLLWADEKGVDVNDIDD